MNDPIQAITSDDPHIGLRAVLIPAI